MLRGCPCKKLKVLIHSRILIFFPHLQAKNSHTSSAAVVRLHGQNWSRQFWVMTWGRVGPRECFISHMSFRNEKTKKCGTISAQLLYPTVHWCSMSVTVTLPCHCIPSLKWHRHDLWILHIDFDDLASSILIGWVMQFLIVNSIEIRLVDCRTPPLDS